MIGSVVVFGIWLALAAGGACTEAKASKEALTSSGYSDVETGDYAWWKCADTYATKFVATNPVGRRVEGAVCCGWLTKGCTIRF